MSKMMYSDDVLDALEWDARLGAKIERQDRKIRKGRRSKLTRQMARTDATAKVTIHADA